jgi:predicted phage terminase large subunit-like protein
LLKAWFSDILYDNPERQSPRWSDEGLIFKRLKNPKEACVEAWGLVDSMPTGMHFNILLYDDVVTLGSVTNAEQIQKTMEAFEMSRNLGSGEDTLTRIIGTRYHFNDAYGQIIKRGVAIPRVYPATVDGTVSGEPVLRSREFLEKRYREMGQYVFSSQMLQNPIADSTQGFQRQWLKYFDDVGESRHMNKYVLVDPASQKKARSDWTAIAVVGLGPDENLYLLDAVRDRLNLTERGAAVMRMHRKWRPKVVGYERYGMQADIEYIRELQKRENYRFDVIEVGGQMPKADRIRRLIPFFEAGRFYLPDSLFKTVYDKSTVNLVEVLIEEEMMGFPVSLHDDLLDAISRIFDTNMVWPRSVVQEEKPERYKVQKRRSWMA